MSKRTFRLAAVPLLATLSLGACADMTDTQRRTGTGALGGAALGGLIGSFGGNAGWGALVGSAGGAGAGYLFDQSERSRERAYYRGRAEGRRSARYRDGRGPY